MEKKPDTVAEFIVLLITAAFMFWRWADHCAFGDLIGTYIGYISALGVIPTLLIAWAAYRKAPRAPYRAIAAATALALAFCYCAAIVTDLWRFQILGSPGSKEMAQLAMHKHIAFSGLRDWQDEVALRFRHGICFGAIIVLLLLIYLVRLSASFGKPPKSDKTGVLPI